MTSHVFVDETKQRGYVVAAAVIRSTDVATYRQSMKDLIMSRQRRIHFTNESNPRRNKILDTYRELRKHGLGEVVRYDHLRAYEECLLAIPDVVAWCWARGGHWRARAKGMVSEAWRLR